MSARPLNDDHPRVEATRIVIVDDSFDIADALAAMLELDGYDVRTAQDGEEALQVVEQHRPSCVVLDVRLPKLDGTALATLLRERYANDMLLIAMSGLDRREASACGILALVDHFLVKPVDPGVLSQLLPPLLATKSGGG